MSDRILNTSPNTLQVKLDAPKEIHNLKEHLTAAERYVCYFGYDEVVFGYNGSKLVRKMRLYKIQCIIYMHYIHLILNFS